MSYSQVYTLHTALHTHKSRTNTRVHQHHTLCRHIPHTCVIQTTIKSHIYTLKKSTYTQIAIQTQECINITTSVAIYHTPARFKRHARALYTFSRAVYISKQPHTYKSASTSHHLLTYITDLSHSNNIQEPYIYSQGPYKCTKVRQHHTILPHISRT